MTLAVVVFLTLSLSGSVTGIFQQVEINLFYLRFEYLYRDSQRLASAEGSNVELQLTKDKVSNGRCLMLKEATRASRKFVFQVIRRW